ncbi:MAG: hypothetical protein QF890_04330 [Myxococcota bacterium]|nr:hypothetical protein [Deltaproteobacteria bacterium]MDP6076125.1 hypothetical protein [Myxococcota bacterium]MDP7073527.1 hypothetical protein [Myxococcota bacterium]MDP7300683.1 hypothetical protein [Myxococcota bacterium]MDP7431783.1 hypothetical protein [Myxococcota bacterium]
MIHVRGWGPVALEEALQAPVDLAAHPEFESDYGVVADLSALEFDPGAHDVLEIGRNLVRIRSLYRYRMAVVVSAPLSLAAELAAAIAGAGGVELRIFTDLASAQTWARPKLEAES